MLIIHSGGMAFSQETHKFFGIEYHQINNENKIRKSIREYRSNIWHLIIKKTYIEVSK